MAITHLKLFVDGDSRQVALFRGSDEQADWERNCPAEEVLSRGWHLLPKEELIAVTAVEAQGFLRAGALVEEENTEAANPNPLLIWQLRAASLHNRLADQAAEAGDLEAEAQACAEVARWLAAMGDGPRQAAWLLRAARARLAQWEQERKPEIAEALAALYGQLAQQPWPGEPEAPAKGAANRRFWLGQALELHAERSLQAEASGELAAAATAAAAVVALRSALTAA